MEGDSRMQSLNAMLKWSVEQSTATGSAEESKPIDPEFVKKNKEIIDDMFRDEYEDIGKLREIVASDDSNVEERAEALESLQEFGEDLNYGQNFGKVGVFKAVLDCLNKHEEEIIWINGVWLLGTTMQHADAVKSELVQVGVMTVIHKALTSSSSKVRAKGMMATSALLRHSPKHLELFKSENGVAEIRALLLDSEQQPRERALFFLENCRLTDCSWFADDVAEHEELILKLVDRVLKERDEAAASAIAEALLSIDAVKKFLVSQGKDVEITEAAKKEADLAFKKLLLQLMIRLR